MSDLYERTKASIHDLSFFGAAAEQILCRPAPDYEIVDYQVDIMNSRSELFLPGEWIQEGHRAYLIYDKSAYISLEQYFLKQTTERAELFHCLWQMLSCIEVCRDILLDPRQIILDERFIFLKRLAHNSDQVLNVDPQFIYVPAEATASEPIPDPEASLLSHIVELFIEEGQKKSLFLEEEVRVLRQYVMGDIPRFMSWLEEKTRYPEKPKRRKAKSASVGIAAKSATAGIAAKSVPANVAVKAASANVAAKVKPSTAISFEQTDETAESKTQRPALIKSILLINIILLFLLNISLGLAIRTQAFHYYALTAIGLFILIGSDVYLLQSNKKDSVSDTRFERERRQKLLRELEFEEEQQQTEAAFHQAGKAQAEANHFSIAYLYPVAGADIHQVDLEHTIQKSKAAAVILNREFYIGSDTDRCDFKPRSNNLSPLHARISKQDESYLLTDLASESGTYLNNLRLHYYEDYVLFSGAFIRFDDLTYLFVTEEASDLRPSA